MTAQLTAVVQPTLGNTTKDDLAEMRAKIATAQAILGKSKIPGTDWAGMLSPPLNSTMGEAAGIPTKAPANRPKPIPPDPFNEIEEIVRHPEAEELSRWEAIKLVEGKFPPRWTEFRQMCAFWNIPVGSHNDVLADIKTAWLDLLGEIGDEGSLLLYLLQQHGMASTDAKMMPLPDLAKLMLDDSRKKHVKLPAKNWVEALLARKTKEPASIAKAEQDKSNWEQKSRARQANVEQALDGLNAATGQINSKDAVPEDAAVRLIAAAKIPWLDGGPFTGGAFVAFSQDREYMGESRPVAQLILTAAEAGDSEKVGGYLRELAANPGYRVEVWRSIGELLAAR